MIIIISRSNDGTSSEVIDWIKNLSNKFVLRLNMDVDDIEFIEFNEPEKKFILKKNQEYYNLYDCDAFWYRKGSNPFKDNSSLNGIFYSRLKTYLTKKINAEINVLYDYILFFLENHATIKLGSGHNTTPNKLSILHLAKQFGLATPDTFVVQKYSELEVLILKFGELITKPLSDGVYYFDNKYSFYTYTELINLENLKKLPFEFFPSLFQVKIDKLFEIRTFFLEDEYYSMAILSQNNERTKVDFRIYDAENPNRCIPFELPESIINKLRRLFNYLKMNTGSIDFIVDKNGEFYFLEVNPVGQFSMVSHPCNYYLEKKVAQFLIEKKV